MSSDSLKNPHLSLDLALGSDGHGHVADLASLGLALAHALLAVLDVDGLGHGLAVLDHGGLPVSALGGGLGSLGGLGGLLGRTRSLLRGLLAAGFHKHVSHWICIYQTCR